MSIPPTNNKSNHYSPSQENKRITPEKDKNASLSTKISNWWSRVWKPKEKSSFAYKQISEGAPRKDYGSTSTTATNTTIHPADNIPTSTKKQT